MELIAVHHGSWPKHTVWLARSKAKVVFAEHEKVKSISYQCNPNKFEAHLLAHPEMYFNRKVRATAWKAMSGPEFLGIS